jgi:hypothetical protein
MSGVPSRYPVIGLNTYIQVGAHVEGRQKREQKLCLDGLAGGVARHHIYSERIFSSPIFTTTLIPLLFSQPI